MGLHKTKALTEAILVKAAKRKGKFMLADGAGLMIRFNNPTGKPAWVMRLRRNYKDVRDSFGHWPAVSLAQARLAHAAALKKLPPVIRRPTPAEHAALTRAAAPGKAAEPTAAPPERMNTGMRIGSVLIAASAAVELVESFGFEWNGKRWIRA